MFVSWLQEWPLPMMVTMPELSGSSLMTQAEAIRAWLWFINWVQQWWLLPNQCQKLVWGWLSHWGSISRWPSNSQLLFLYQRKCLCLPTSWCWLAWMYKEGTSLACCGGGTWSMKDSHEQRMSDEGMLVGIQRSDWVIKWQKSHLPIWWLLQIELPSR